MWLDYVPEEVRDIFRQAKLHTLAAGERMILSKLRTMTVEDYEAVPYGGEGLHRKLMHNARRFANLEDVITATKSKRYTRTRIDRMILCAFLGQSIFFFTLRFRIKIKCHPVHGFIIGFQFHPARCKIKTYPR